MNLQKNQPRRESEAEGWDPSSASFYYPGSVIETPAGSGLAGETRG